MVNTVQGVIDLILGEILCHQEEPKMSSSHFFVINGEQLHSQYQSYCIGNMTSVTINSTLLFVIAYSHKLEDSALIESCMRNSCYRVYRLGNKIIYNYEIHDVHDINDSGYLFNLSLSNTNVVLDIMKVLSGERFDEYRFTFMYTNTLTGLLK